MSGRIIGGEYTIDRDAHVAGADKKHCSYFSSGRSALRAVLGHALPEKKGTILVPDYICGSVPETIKNIGLNCLFYRIQVDLRPCIDTIMEKLNSAEAILFVNYFGMLPPDDINYIIDVIKEKKDDIIIIIDDVQNYYGLETENRCDYAFTSFRKWFPVPDGASAVWNNKGEKEYLFPDNDVSAVFSKYKFAGNVLKNYRDIVGDEICLELLEKGEGLIATEGTSTALSWTMCEMKRRDFREIQKKRRENAAVLHNGLVKMGITHEFYEEGTPLFVPIILEKNRDRVRKVMFEHMVFCPVHWNDDWKSQFVDVEKNKLADWELSLICDHRYNEQDMAYQLELLKDEGAFF